MFVCSDIKLVLTQKKVKVYSVRITVLQSDIAKKLILELQNYINSRFYRQLC